MFARLTEIEDVDPARRAEVERLLRENVLPAVRATAGFAGFVSLIDEHGRRVRALALWDTHEHAEEAERQMKSRREQLVAHIGASIRSTEMYEVVIAELQK